jgi:hypothetical protein
MTATPPEDFGDLADFLAIEPKRLTILGTEYEFPGDVSAQTFLFLEHMMGAAAAAGVAQREGREITPRKVLLDDTEEMDLRGELFGDAAQQMLDDEVPNPYQQRALVTLMTWHVYGKDAARAVWRGDASGEAPAPNRAARRAQTRASTRTGAATSTRTRASTSGTRSPRTSSAGGTRTP